MHLIKILSNLCDGEFDTELLTDCKLVPNYDLRAYIKRWTVKMNFSQIISKDAFISFSSNKKATLLFEINDKTQLVGIDGMIKEYGIEKERVMLFSKSIAIESLSKICLKKGFRLSRGI